MGLTAKGTGSFRGMMDKVIREEIIRKEELNHAGKQKKEKTN